MLASSPSPSSAALRSPLQTSSGAASHPPRYEPTGAPHFSSPRSSRLAIDELRSALNRHTVDPSSPEFSGDLHRRRLSASTTATKTPVTHSSALASASSSQPESSATPSSATPSTKVAASSVPNPPVPSVAPSMPALSGSGSNKRNSQSDDPPDAPDPELEGSQSKRLCSSKSEVKVLPAQYELAEPRDLVVLISSMLMELIRFNDKIPLHQGRLTRFHSRSPPRISVQDYLQRLTTHATLSPPILLSMVYYIDRLCALYPAFTVSSLTIHRFLIASATVASKGLSDSFWTNKTYSRVGGISMTELAMLELEFLFRVQWRIVPQPEVLVDYYQSLVERCEGFKIERTSGGSNGVQFSTVNATSIS